MNLRATMLFAAAFALAPSLHAQKTAQQILADPAVQAAMKSIEAREPHFLDEQARLTEIPAPPFHETVRGKELQRLFTAAGLKNVRMDATGNVLGDRPGTQPHPLLVIRTPSSLRAQTSTSNAAAPP